MEITNVEETVSDILSEKVNFNELDESSVKTFCEKFDSLEESKKSDLALQLIDKFSDEDLKKDNFSFFFNQENIRQILIEYVDEN